MNYISLLSNDHITQEYTKLAYKTIVTDLIVGNIRGIKRAVGVDYWSDEASFASYKTFIPGNFYIFKYEGDSVIQGKHVYHDMVPVILVLAVGEDPKSKKDYVYGLNFNLLPGISRAVILQELNDMDKTFFEETIYKEHTKGRHVFSKIVLKSLQIDGGVKFINYISEKYNINKNSFAFRRYYMNNIEKYRLIDIWQWKYLPFLDYKQGIRGVEIKKIQSENTKKAR